MEIMLIEVVGVHLKKHAQHLNSSSKNDEKVICEFLSKTFLIIGFELRNLLVELYQKNTFEISLFEYMTMKEHNFTLPDWWLKI